MTGTSQPPAAPQQSDLSDLASAVQSPQPGASSRPRHLMPHRGGTVLALGILGLVACVICGIIAWVMGNNDLREMAAGRMDRSGENLTRAGKTCGMISTILGGIGFVIWMFVLLASAS